MAGSFGLPNAEGAAAIAHRIRTRSATAVEVVEDHLARLASRANRSGVSRGPTTTPCSKPRAPPTGRSPKTPRRSDRCTVPITVKDWIDVAGFPCAGESARHRDRRPAADATVVARLRAAGAIVIAKTAAGDRNEIYGVTRNPHDHTRSPGASSSGEGALVGVGRVAARHRERQWREHSPPRSVVRRRRPEADRGARPEYRPLPAHRSAARRPHPDRAARGGSTISRSRCA